MRQPCVIVGCELSLSQLRGLAPATARCIISDCSDMAIQAQLSATGHYREDCARSMGAKQSRRTLRAAGACFTMAAGAGRERRNRHQSAYANRSRRHPRSHHASELSTSHAQSMAADSCRFRALVSMRCARSITADGCEWGHSIYQMVTRYSANGANAPTAVANIGAGGPAGSITTPPMATGRYRSGGDGA